MNHFITVSSLTFPKASLDEFCGNLTLAAGFGLAATQLRRSPGQAQLIIPNCSCVLN